ncbi:MAG: hypothetical protein R3315_08620 [Woeseiaceae bacterium]|nr:hypothetical protein [Woeseiaceae bacterium]
MNTWIRNLSAAIALLLASVNACADHNLWMGVKAGTLGLGVEGAWRPLPWFDVRVGANGFNYDESGSQAGINYDADLTLETFYATANFRFPLSPMRFSVGAFSNGNELQLVSRDAAAFEVGGTVYPAAAVGTLTSVTSFESTAPYAGVGFDFDLFDKVGLNLDLGVLWQGEPDVTLNADGVLANDPTFQSALERERQELIAEVEDYKAWPVVSLGFTYKFL